MGLCKIYVDVRNAICKEPWLLAERLAATYLAKSQTFFSFCTYIFSVLCNVARFIDFKTRRLFYCSSLSVR